MRIVKEAAERKNEILDAAAELFDRAEKEALDKIDYYKKLNEM